MITNKPVMQFNFNDLDIIVGKVGKKCSVKNHFLMNMICTYRIVNRKTGWAYTGATANMYRRWRKHLNDLDSVRHSNGRLQDAYIAYSKHFEMQIISVLENTNDLLRCEALDTLAWGSKLYNFRVADRWADGKMRWDAGSNKCGYKPKTKRGPNTVSRWYDHTSTAVAL